MAIDLDNITSGFNVSKINANFQKVEDYINDKLLARAETGVAGEAKMERDLDMDGHKILNAELDGSSITNDHAIRVPIGEGPIDAIPDSDEDRRGKVITFDVNTGQPRAIAPASGSAIDVLNQLAAPTGAALVGTNHRGTLQQDLDTVDIRTSGQSLNTLLSAGSDVEIDTSLPTTAITQNDVSLSGKKGGSVTATKQTIGLNISGSNSEVTGLVVQGAGDVLPSDTLATYLYRFGDNNAGGYSANNSFSKATMGAHARLSKDVTMFNNYSTDMVYHPSLNAGGYAILTEGVENCLILGGTSKGTANDRHAIYVSNEPSLRANKDVRIIGYRADYSGANAGGVDGARNMPMINVRITDGLVIDSCQLRGGGQGIGLLNNLGTPQRITISNNQITDLKKTFPDDPCVGIGTSFTAGNGPISGVTISNNLISLSRASGVIDGVRAPIGISLTQVRNVTMSGNVVSTPPDSYPLTLADCRDVTIDGLNGLPGVGSGTAQALIRFEGACIDVKVSNLSFTNRPSAFSNLDAVTNLTVDFPRMCEVFYNAGVLSTVDPDGLLSSVTLSGSNVVVTFKNHVTQIASDTANIRPMLSATPINVITGTGSRSLTIGCFTGGNVQTNPSTGQVRFKIILSQ